MRNTAVNLVMVSQHPTLFNLNISCTTRLLEVNMSFTLLILATINTNRFLVATV